jgi:hypothetical protein
MQGQNGEARRVWRDLFGPRFPLSRFPDSFKPFWQIGINMSTWSLPTLLAGLHEDIQQQLATARKSFQHPGTKGDATEAVWLELLQKYLPQRYQAATAHVVDSKGNFSDQIDIVVFDRQYSPLIFTFKEQIIIPAESVYAVFEAKQTINADLIDYAKRKAASVRRLHRTSLPIPHAGGVHSVRPLTPILAGILALESDWHPPLGDSLIKALNVDVPDGRLDIGCVAAHGTFSHNIATNECDVTPSGKPATALLFELIARLQSSATVPMIDIRAYGAWLDR